MERSSNELIQLYCDLQQKYGHNQYKHLQYNYKLFRLTLYSSSL